MTTTGQAHGCSLLGKANSGGGVRGGLSEWLKESREDNNSTDVDRDVG